MFNKGIIWKGLLMYWCSKPIAKYTKYKRTPTIEKKTSMALQIYELLTDMIAEQGCQRLHSQDGISTCHEYCYNLAIANSALQNSCMYEKRCKWIKATYVPEYEMTISFVKRCISMKFRRNMSQNLNLPFHIWIIDNWSFLHATNVSPVLRSFFRKKSSKSICLRSMKMSHVMDLRNCKT
jgi:hypothetical protein